MTERSDRHIAWLAEQREAFEATLVRDVTPPPAPPPDGRASLEALAVRMRETSDACLNARELFDVDTAFYYPVTWLNVHCARAHCQADKIPPGSTMSLFLEPLPVLGGAVPIVMPRAWIVDVFDAADPSAKIDILMTGAVIDGMSQFPFYRYSNPPQGIPTRELSECTVDGWPLAPRVRLGAFGRTCNGQNLEVQMLNTSTSTISAHVTVWGDVPPSEFEFGRPVPARARCR